MAAPRLPFLWPMLAKGFEAATPAMRSTKAAARMRAFHSCSPRRRPEVAPRQPRYGTANQPPPHLGGGKAMPPPTRTETSEQTKLPKIGEKLQKDGEEEVKAEQAVALAEKRKDERQKPATSEAKETSKIQTDPMLDAEDGPPEAKPPGSPDMPPDKPLESLLHTVPDPAQHSDEQQAQPNKEAPEDTHPKVSFDEHTPSIKAPHINTPRHVHHFDTFGLVQRLMDSGWTESQAITIMKGMRVLLSDNMNIAQEALVNKSQVENETYLFRAACAELKTEVTARRKSEQEKMRTERSQLQHEVEILSQKLGQESGALKDELKGMFDDRKMAVRNEQREMESKIQRLNYQITVDLQADAKSEVEGLRWVMTRRVILALGLVIIMVIGSLKLYSNAVHEQELDAKRRANMRGAGTQTDSSGGNGFVGEGAQPKLEGGADVSYVSLG
ncbi:hypothetical protein PRZ48_003387 [Zasmidium cellare]|uniref:Uncharacterized protein n=1 Tax=Zasmidium cellare TaxID=395010 RepID=A0ABR0EVJ9_ZASCE|nr:hypothetical protein PRZ48_003387 [Zasmidium cellare]